MADKQYWREMDKATHYPPEQMTKMQATALKSLKVREKKTRIVERKAKAEQAVELRKIAKKKAKAKDKAKKKPPKKRKPAKKKIQKARTVTRTLKNIFG